MEKNNAIVLIVVVGVLALLVGCVGGALAGGVASYFIAERAETSQIEQPTPGIRREFRVPIVPRTPAVPELRMDSVYALVTAVTTDSPADRAGIEVGDMITQFDGQELPEGGPAALIKDYAPGDRITLTVVRGTDELDIAVTLGENPNSPGKAWLGITYQAIPGNMQRFGWPDQE